MRHRPAPLAAALLTVASLGVVGHGQDPATPPVAPAETDPRWLDRIDRDDRAALDAAIGFAPPAFTEDLQWSGTAPLTWEGLRGKVVVLQSWTSKSSGARSAPRRLEAVLREAKSPDLVLLALHTPEGAEEAPAFIERASLEIPSVIDPRGSFCDGLGVYRRPVNVLVDRQGTVRYAGLNPSGLRKAVESLLAEPFDPDVKPRERASTDTPAANATFPQPTGTLRSARDLRGQQAPPFVVERWLTDQPTPGSRLVLVDFWATWCGPCMAAVPHMNELAARYGSDVCVVGLTDESKSQVEQGLIQRNRKPSDFHYPLASDTRKRLSSAFGVTGIPHCVIISSDNVVRWQGHPSELNAQVMDQLVAANRALAGAASGGGAATGGPPRRWTGG